MSDTPPAIPAKAARYPGSPRQKVPAFARYEGTSAWRKDRRRVREYYRFLATTKQASQAAPTPAA